MNWPNAHELMHLAALPGDYRYQILRRMDVPEIASSVRQWQPSWTIGAASVYLRESFYEDSASFEGEAPRDMLIVLIRKGNELAGMASFERDLDTLSLYSGLFVLAPEHRGVGLSKGEGDPAEAIARAMGLEYVYVLVTLKYPQSQKHFERAGFLLTGFAPGYDREEVSPGVFKRVYEAVYAKVLVADDEVDRPKLENMTPTVRKLFEIIFPEEQATNPES